MYKVNRRTKHLRRYCVSILNRDVFATVHFIDKEQRDILYDSYIQNLDNLIEYVAVNKLDFTEYFKSIREVLLNSEHVREH